MAGGTIDYLPRCHRLFRVKKDFSVFFRPRAKLNNSLDLLYWNFAQIVAGRFCYYKAVYLKIFISTDLTVTSGVVVDVVRVVPGANPLLGILHPADGDQGDHCQDQ